MDLYLIRHGETAYNRDGLGLGRADIPLTEHGQRQAAALGARFATKPFDQIVVSPLQRAGATAAALAGAGVPLTVDADLTEMDVGETEGMSFAAMRERFPEFLGQWATGEDAGLAMPGGESLNDVVSRVRRTLSRLEGFEGKTVAVVSHNFVLRLMLCELLAMPAASFRSFGSDLAGVSHLSKRRGRVYVHTINDRCHLDHLLEH
ncbi:MAG: histidine phosphatase family protein [Dehalococcoidia bacterium]